MPASGDRKDTGRRERAREEAKVEAQSWAE